MNARLFGEVAVTMLVVLDPPGNMPIFLAVTRQLKDKERHRAAYIAVGTAFFIIALFAVGGRTVLDYLNVSVPALRRPRRIRSSSQALHSLSSACRRRKSPHHMRQAQATQQPRR